ncbi:hypothetical protein JVT61DRAFT_9578 [Boletus reticuloceps]|uniref:Uncharacterized protein n=1 Tax=Boletus reticuloceps TaxID=495285 RepID=A0A8I2YGA2_9AGAM|nr:hypothetical protein JVT61DRAFT_9578 [Boletus reticuloceps]
MVQSIFSSLGKVYFEVDPTVTSESNLDVRRYLRGTLLPALVDDPVILQDSDRDRPPLLKITLWDEFEPVIRANISQREAARVIKEKHTAKEHGGIFLSLEKAVKLYHVTTRVLLNSFSHSFTICKVLLNGPGFAPEQTKYFQILPKENESYNSLYLQMVWAMIRKELGDEFDMKFVYNSRQRNHLNTLLDCLWRDAEQSTEMSEKNVLCAYHAFCWSLVHSPEPMSQKQWGNPIQRFLWLKALWSDGSFLPAKDVTPILVQLKYFCRLVTLYEVLANYDATLPAMEDPIQQVGRHHTLALQLGMVTPFNMVYELQQFVSALVYNQVADPQVYVDPNYEWISIGRETLHLQRLREGMQHLVQTVKEMTCCQRPQ